MNTMIYKGQTEGITLEHMKRSSVNMHINHFHNEYEIYFLLRGERIFFFGNRAYHIKAGDLILVDSNQIHMTHAVSNNKAEYERIILYINKTKMETFDTRFSHLNLSTFFRDHYGVYTLTDVQQKDFLALSSSLTEEFIQRSRNYTLMLELEIVKYFIDFMRKNQRKSPVSTLNTYQKNNKYQTVYLIADYISEHYCDSLTLEFLANKFYLSKCYLSRIFKEVTGHGLNEYINILRIQKAKQLLEETSLNISEIAAYTGYKSTTYFEKIFKIYFSVSPLKYRKMQSTICFTLPITSDEKNS